MGTGYSLVALPQWYHEGSTHYGRAGFERASRAFRPEDLQVDASGKVILVTGANSGIGKSAAQLLAQKKATVHIVCRNKERGEKALEELKTTSGNEKLYLHVADMSEFDDVRAFVKKFLAEEERLDVLVHNAGVMPETRQENSAGVELSLATMLGGSFILPSLLLPLLQKTAEKTGQPSRIVNVSSAGMYNVKLNVDDLNLKNLKKYDGTLAYAFNKRQQVYLTEMMAQRLRNRGVVVNAMHPGWADTPGVRTAMKSFSEQKQGSFRSSDEGADTIVWLSLCDRIKEETGKFWFDRQAVKTHLSLAGTKSSSKDLERFWAEIEKITGEKFPLSLPEGETVMSEYSPAAMKEQPATE